MTLDEHFRRTFAELTDRLRDDVTRLTAAAAEELVAAAEREAETRVTDAIAEAHDRTAESVSMGRQRVVAEAARLLDAVRTLDRAASLSEILDTLAASAAAEMPRAAVLLVRGGVLRGWKLIGFGAELGRAADLEVTLDEAGLIAAAVRTQSLAAASEGSPAFATLPPGRDCVALPLVVAGAVVAVLYGDDGHGDDAANGGGGTEPAHIGCGPHATSLEVLVRHAARCLETITVLRTAQAMAGPPTAPARVASTAAGGRRDRRAADRGGPGLNQISSQLKVS